MTPALFSPTMPPTQSFPSILTELQQFRIVPLFKPHTPALLTIGVFMSKLSISPAALQYSIVPEVKFSAHIPPAFFKLDSVPL